MRQIISLFFLSMSCMIVFSCNSITQKKFEFFYYPARNVYYDVNNNLYLYSLDGGKTWDSLSVVMNSEPAIPGGKQIIYSATPAVWTENEEHIKQYNGKVINITGSDTGNSKEDPVAERRAKKTKSSDITASTNTAKKTDKKPGFFKRLFGKKN